MPAYVHIAHNYIQTPGKHPNQMILTIYFFKHGAIWAGTFPDTWEKWITPPAYRAATVNGATCC